MTKSTTRSKGFTLTRSSLIQAAGKSLSAKNKDSLSSGLSQIQAGCADIRDVLGETEETQASAGVATHAAGKTLSAKNRKAIDGGLSKIDKGCTEIEAVLGDGNKDTKASASPAEPVEAGALIDAVRYKSWFAKLSTLLSSAKYMYLDLHVLKLSSLQDWYSKLGVESEQDRAEAIQSCMNDLIGMLQSMTADYPQIGEGMSYYYDALYDMYYGYTEMAAKQEDLPESEELTVQAGALADEVNLMAWARTLATIFSEFKQRFCEDHYTPMNSEEGAEGDRRNSIGEMIGDFEELLTDHSNEFSRLFPAEGVMASAGVDVQASGDPTVAAGQSGLETHSVSASIVLEPYRLRVSEAVLIDGFTGEEPLDIPIEIQAKGLDSSNLHPVTGVLFRVDEASERPPKVGPGLPLYIPAGVAEKALDVANKPLEAAEGLLDHAAHETCGVMSEATIVGNDFCISGYVWPKNHAAKLKEILDAQGELGMSLNGEVTGRPALMQGKKVFLVEELALHGAAILLAEAATFQKTKLAASSAAPSPQSEITAMPIAASGQTSPTDVPNRRKPKTMELEQLAQQLTDMQTALTNKISAVKADVSAEVTEQLAGLDARIAVFEAERAAAQEEADRQAAEAQQAQQAQALLGQMVESFRGELPSLVQQAVAQQFNPQLVPARKTAPVVGNDPAAQQQAQQLHPAQALYMQKAAQLQYARTNNGSVKSRLALQQELKDLAFQMQQAGIAAPSSPPQPALTPAAAA